MKKVFNLIKQKTKTGKVNCRLKNSLAGLTLLEMVISLSIIIIIMAIMAPQISTINKSWSSKATRAEAIQNGRVLVEHINRNLKKAVRIIDVSGSSVNLGYIEFEDNNGDTQRYEVSGSNLVQFGEPGSLFDLAGPVNQFQLACYSKDDFATTITDADLIRYVQVQLAVVNSNPTGHDETFVASAYLQSNSTLADDDLYVADSHFEFDVGTGETPTLAKIDETHYLCAYEGADYDGWAIILTVDPSTQTVNAGTPFEFDTKRGQTPTLIKIDAEHYLCAYTGDRYDGFAVVLTVDKSTWTITRETPFEFDTNLGMNPALAKIDDEYYLCAYESNTGGSVPAIGIPTAVILKVDQITWQITMGTPLVYDAQMGGTPALSQVDSKHYLCVYNGEFTGAYSVILTVDTASMTVTNGTNRLVDAAGGKWPDLIHISSNVFLCAYTANANWGFCRVLEVDTLSWTVRRRGGGFEFGPGQGKYPALRQIDSKNYIIAWDSVGSAGEVAILTLDTRPWVISKSRNSIFDKRGRVPAVRRVNGSVYLCVYSGVGLDGWAVLFDTEIPIRP